MNDLSIIDQALQSVDQGQIYRHVISDTERVLLERVLQECRGNQVIAARMLGLNRNTLRTKIRKLNISLEKYKLI